MLRENRKQEHTASYYAATVNEHTHYPPLADAISADVCVIGAGFTGVSTALALAERGYSVALVEANRVGWGASGRNGGQVINGMAGLAKMRRKYGDSAAAVLQDIKWRGNDIIRERVAKYGIDCDLKDGFAEVAVKPRQMRILGDYVEEREQVRAENRTLANPLSELGDDVPPNTNPDLVEMRYHRRLMVEGFIEWADRMRSQARALGRSIR